MQTYIGMDLGGTNIRVGMVDVDGGQVSNWAMAPTRSQEGHEAVIGRMAVMIGDVLRASGVKREQVGGVGVGVPGVLDLDTGRTVFLPNLTGFWRDIPLRDTLVSLVGLPIELLNDARSITYGEWRFGAGRGASTMACVAVGTGIGGGLVVNGRLHLGIGGEAGELGHQIINFDGPRCSCGNKGCLEAYASGRAIADLGRRAVDAGAASTLGEMAGGDGNLITAELVYQAALGGDSVARGILEEVGFYIGIALANVCVSIGPTRIVIAGGVAAAGDLLLEPIRRTVRERVKVMPIDQVLIVPSELGANAGVVGAAAWARFRRES